ncbi:MAG: DUF535 family protein [Massilia sp.]|nr:DUF535 family protein [Massilia sp.]
MVLVHLGKHWYARRHYPFVSWAACVARSARVLLFYRDHRGLLGLDVYRQHLTQVHDDVFHHLSHRNYLAKGLSLRERVRCVQTHYRFEAATFDGAYQRAVYRDGGLVVWQHAADGLRCTVQLEMAERLNAEGDLTLTARLDGIRLHRLSFSWVDSGFAGVPAASKPAVMSAMVPFVARNQGHHAEAAAAFADFERLFPQNSPSFFCFAALQGIAQALGMEQIVAVKAAAQCACDPHREQRFVNAYDGFWQTLGGAPLAGRGWRIPLPLQLKPLAEMSAKHRRRAAMRRAHWGAIADAAGAAVARHLLRRFAPL